jgi:hypothetical protein
MKPDWVRDQVEAAERAEGPAWKRARSWLARTVMWPLVTFVLFALVVTVGTILVSAVRAVLGI